MLWQARSQILLWYASLMLIFTGIAIPIVYQLVFHQVNIRVKEDLKKEVENFEEFLVEHSNDLQNDPNSTQLETILDKFLSQSNPEDDNYLITIVNNRFYRSVPGFLPKEIQKESALMKTWTEFNNLSITQPKQLNSYLDYFQYSLKPIIINDKIAGVFIAVHYNVGEREEAFEILLIFIQVLFVGLIFAIILAWVASGRILKPLKSLTKVANEIGQFDLNQRLALEGSGEIYDLINTFNKMLNRLENAFESQRHFLNDICHELRTPITIIQGHLELMGDDPQEQEETITLVLDEIERMNRLVNDLVLLAKSERPDFLQKEVINIPAFTEEIYHKAMGLGSRQWLLENKATAKIIGDRQRLTQALMNLAQNAVQHTKENGTIIIGSHQDRNDIQIWIKDNGNGIEDEDKEYLFERFFQGNSEDKMEGSGLGLSIVKAIVEAHQGSIECVSQVDQGSKFTIFLPTNDRPDIDY
ncbi:HAMP domain-containing sensor histidine kinase [Crocosphaera sp.]|uniref:sensor histidine kinase n=1 Tax=Crocosphaera sp. TaxID=2729996 RepID=UPI00261133BD|nr:HAMP domain-containing sensor histidine kinase [Crocosphaera sp.]MDJ0578809.1 HAMP domain-containing sensor histidine kinase [Crocosphaera sp.]